MSTLSTHPLGLKEMVFRSYPDPRDAIRMPDHRDLQNEGDFARPLSVNPLGLRFDLTRRVSPRRATHPQWNTQVPGPGISPRCDKWKILYKCLLAGDGDYS